MSYENIGRYDHWTEVGADESHPPNHTQKAYITKQYNRACITMPEVHKMLQDAIHMG